MNLLATMKPNDCYVGGGNSSQPERSFRHKTHKCGKACDGEIEPVYNTRLGSMTSDDYLRRVGQPLKTLWCDLVGTNFDRKLCAECGSVLEFDERGWATCRNEGCGIQYYAGGPDHPVKEAHFKGLRLCPECGSYMRISRDGRVPACTNCNYRAD